MNPALLRNIALETNDQGEADAQIALVARRMIDRNGEVQINPDDLAASMRALGGGGAVPMWRKFSVSLADLQAGVEENGKVKVKLFTAAVGTIINDAASRPVEMYDAPVEEALPMDTIRVSVGKTGLEETFHENTGFSAPAEDVDNWVRGTNAAAQGNAQPNLMKVPTDVNAYFYLTGVPFSGTLDLATAALFTAGAVDIWLLISVLP